MAYLGHGLGFRFLIYRVSSVAGRTDGFIVGAQSRESAKSISLALFHEIVGIPNIT